MELKRDTYKEALLSGESLKCCIIGSASESRAALYSIQLYL